MKDETTISQPAAKQLEQEAIDLYRAKYPEGPLWQELHYSTRVMWVTYAENKREWAHKR